MVNIGTRIVELRKAKDWGQADLAKAVNASRDIIGKYERGENSPSIEMAVKIARVFDVSMDYLVGEGKNASFSNETVRRMEDIEILDENTKTILFNIIDTFLRDAQARKAYSPLKK